MDIELTKEPDDDHPAGTVEVISVDGERVVIHYAHLPEKDRAVVRGIPCTSALRTVIDIAPDVFAGHLTRIVDNCLDRGLFTAEEALARACEPDMADHVGAWLLRGELQSRMDPLRYALGGVEDL
jgi:hypothetical protein